MYSSGTSLVTLVARRESEEGGTERVIKREREREREKGSVAREV